MRRVRKIVLLAVASVLVMALVVYIVGIEETKDAVLEAGVLAFLSVGVLLAGMLALQAAAWRQLLRAVGHRVRFSTLLQASTVGLAGNILTPSTYLGGEPAKVIFIGRKTRLPYTDVAGTVLLAKYIEAISFVLFLGASTATAAVGFRSVLFNSANLPLGIGILVVAAVALAICVMLWMSLSRQWKPMAAVVRTLARLPLWRKFFLRLYRKTVRVELEVSRVFRKKGERVWPAFWLYVGTHVTIFLKPFTFFAFGWMMGLDLADLSLIFLTCQVLLAVQLTPSGAGTLDGGLIAMLHLTDITISAPQCAAFLLCVRFWDVAVIGVAAVMAGRAGARLIRNNHDEADAGTMEIDAADLPPDPEAEQANVPVDATPGK